MSEAASGQTVEGVVARIIYSNEENGWTVLRLTNDEDASEIACVGNLLGTQPGEHLRLNGKWVDDPKFGRQLRVETYRPTDPKTVIGIERYLGSGMVEGIGRELAKRLVEHFGTKTLDVIDHSPERLTEVEGIGPKRKERIAEAWAEQREIRDVMVFLQSHGISTSHAVKIYRRYGKKAVATVRTSPYRLAIDIPGIGFRTADQIAQSLGISREAKERIEAGILHELGLAAEEGNVFEPEKSLIDRTAKSLEINPELIHSAIEGLFAAKLVAIREVPSSPDRAIYLASLDAAEQTAARRFESIAKTPLPARRFDVEHAISTFEQAHGMQLAELQKRAVEAAANSKILVVTGGPGTGKTTVVNAIIRTLEGLRLRLELAAPTGRAARRMSEATGHPARTLHRLLEFSPGEGRFSRNEDDPLEADVVIVDEASMIDLSLFASLVSAIDDHCQLIVIGDVDQLPSVGPGRVLEDIIESQAAAVVRLAHIFRQAKESLIVLNAHAINRGELPQQPPRGDENSDFFSIERNEPDEIVSMLERLITERIPRRFGLDPIDDIQVLTPMNRGPLGTHALNERLQEALNPNRPEISRGNRRYRVGDKVMQLRNNYELDVFNGDIGRVERIDDGGLVSVRFDDRLVEYDSSGLDELTLSYACTIHKSQGSEFPAVILVLHTQHYMMLRRNLLYTAVTRARRLLVVVGSSRAMRLCVSSRRVERRNSQLAHRLRDSTA